MSTERYEGHFIEAVDFVGGPATLEIAGVIPPNTEKDVRKKLIDKPMLQFKGTDKRLILGKTNERLLKAALKEAKAANWKGQKITLMRRYLDCTLPDTGPDTDCVRVVCPEPIPNKCRKFYGTAHPKHSKQ